MMGKKGIEQTVFLMFALIVFIIVAVVVLQMFLRGTSSVEKFGKQVSLEEAIRECENYAVSDIISYCTSIYTIDLNGDGRYTTVPYKRKGNLKVCESSLFCYSLVNNIPGEKCMVELCNYYIYNAKLTPEEATMKTFGVYNLPKKSDITKEVTNVESFTSTILDWEKYKSKEEGKTGYIFIGPNCVDDEIVKGVWRDIGRMLFDSVENNELTVGLHPYNGYEGYLYISSKSLKGPIKNEVDSLYRTLYNEKPPSEIPLCAVLLFTS